MIVVVSTVWPGAADCALMAAGSSVAGPAGLGSRCSTVTECSPIPLLAAASTGNVGVWVPPLETTPGPAFSLRYLPADRAWSSPSSFASAIGSIAAMSIGNAQRTVKPGRRAVRS